VSGTDFGIRDGCLKDAQELTKMYLRSRATAMPWLVSPHDEPATRWWMEHVVLGDQRVWVAQSGDHLLGFASKAGGWLEQLYVGPRSQSGGVGRALLESVKDSSAEGLMLHVFTRNCRARRFYEAAGFVMTEQSDGSRNEELEPDCTYAWSGDHVPARNR